MSDAAKSGRVPLGDDVDDFALEVELLKNSPEFMALMKQLSQEKAAITLQELGNELGL